MIHLLTLSTLQYGKHAFFAAGTACQTVTGTDCGSSLPVVTADKSTIPSVLQIVFGVLAAVTVLMIVIAGMRFITGSSNPQETAKARSTIVYALIGLLIALMAEAFVSFVLDKL